MKTEELKRLARAGIESEIERLNALLKMLDKRAYTRRKLEAPRAGASNERPGMSAAARKATSIRMKAYWAKRRKG